LVLWTWLLSRAMAAPSPPGVVPFPFTPITRDVAMSSLSDSNYIYMAKAFGAQGDVYGHLNRFSWQNTYDKISTNHGQFNLMVLADGRSGVAGFLQGVWTNTGLPIAGFVQNAFPANWLQVGSNALLTANQNGLTYLGFAQITNTGGFALLGHNGNANGNTANVFSVAYHTSPGHGHFLVETSIFGGTFTAVGSYTNVAAASSTHDCLSVRWTNSAGAFPTRVRVTGLDSGKTNDILNIVAINTLVTNSILVTPYGSVASTTFAHLCGTNLTVTGHLFRDYNPDVVVVSSIDTNFAAARALFDTIQSNCTSADIVLLGTYGSDDSTAQTIWDTVNEFYSTNALARDWGYFDGATVFPSSAMVARSWINADHIHPVTAGSVAHDKVVSDWLSFTNRGSFVARAKFKPL